MEMIEALRVAMMILKVSIERASRYAALIFTSKFIYWRCASLRLRHHVLSNLRLTINSLPILHMLMRTSSLSAHKGIIQDGNIAPKDINFRDLLAGIICAHHGAAFLLATTPSAS